MTCPPQTHSSAQELRKISVVLGTLNRLPYLQTTVASIRQSDLKIPLEIIVVDGGSTDGTLRWLAEQEDIITIIQHNISLVDGRKVRKKSWGYFMNLGFKIAQGELICMISDDSVLHPDALARGIETYEAEVKKERRIGGVAFRWRSYPEEKQYRVGYTLGGRMFVNHGFYVKSALEDVGWIEESVLTFYFADGDVCLKMADKGYEVICGEDSYVEHFEILKSHASSVASLKVEQEWRTYLQRWAGIFYFEDSPDIGRFDYADGQPMAFDPGLIPKQFLRDLNARPDSGLKKRIAGYPRSAAKSILRLFQTKPIR